MKGKCIIVADGQSSHGFKAPKGVTVIAVNGVIEWIDRADYWFTLDPHPDNQRRMLNRRKDVIYCAAVDDSYILPRGVARYRRISGRGTEPEDKNSVEWVLWRYSCVLGLDTREGCISTGNSSYGALGLAYHLGFRDVALIGVDGDKSKRVSGGFSGELKRLGALFASALGQINVVSCGKLDAIPQMSLKDWLCE